MLPPLVSSPLVGEDTRVGCSWEARPALLPLPGRERAGVKVQALGTPSPSPRPSPPAGARETKEATPSYRAKNLP
jgi:hypothetical protein